jgi:NADPH-dependent 2,4-dienoyl-CoA reductase/sulfur reductase-like enzyme
MASFASNIFRLTLNCPRRWKYNYRQNTSFRVCARSNLVKVTGIRLFSDYTGPPPTEPAAGAFRNPRKVFSDEKSIYRSRQTGSQVIPRETDVVVIGGGLVGLSTAFWLKQQNPTGYSVTVIEQDDTVSI